MLTIILAGFYAIANGFILVFSLAHARLAILYLRWHAKEKRQPTPPPVWEGDWPQITMQLALYNEKFVVERLIEAVAMIDYPADKLQIQIVDDSTDETSDLVREKLHLLTTRGWKVEHIQRSDREGYKAGALQNALKTASGEFIAIFDADFVPRSDFLKRTIGFFDEKNVGGVQTQWAHLNRNYSLLTKLYGFALDAHFSVEQGGRYYGGHFIQFNGTGGILRRKMIDDAGGWSADTLTEDFDLSIRAQLRGWKLKFIETISAPAELPATINEIKSQQFRWMKGNAETAKKHMWNILTADISLMTKIHAAFQLLGAFVFICALISTTLAAPLIVYAAEGSQLVNIVFGLAAINILALFCLIFFFWASWASHNPQKKWRGLFTFFAHYWGFLAISMALAPNNAIAAVKGYLGVRTPFVRTAKTNITDKSIALSKRKLYVKKSLSPLFALEFLIALYFAGSIILDVQYHAYGFIPFHLIFMWGYAVVCYYSLRQYLMFARA